MKIIIAGSREIQSLKDVHIQFISELVTKNELTELVCGMCHGPDLLAFDLIREKFSHIKIKEFFPKWADLTEYPRRIKRNSFGEEYNALAGMNRNERMAQYADALIAFTSEKCEGTNDMIKRMRKLNKPVTTFRY